MKNTEKNCPSKSSSDLIIETMKLIAKKLLEVKED